MSRVRSCLAVVGFFVVLGPVVLLTLSLFPGLPWWAWCFGAAFWALLLRRRRLAAAGLLHTDDSGPMWSPTRGGGGL